MWRTVNGEFGYKIPLFYYEYNPDKSDERELAEADFFNSVQNNCNGKFNSLTGQLITDFDCTSKWWLPNIQASHDDIYNKISVFEFEVDFKLDSEFKNSEKTWPVQFLLANSPTGYIYLTIDKEGVLSIGYKHNSKDIELLIIPVTDKVHLDKNNRIRFVWFGNKNYYVELNDYKKMSEDLDEGFQEIPFTGRSNRISYSSSITINKMSLNMINYESNKFPYYGMLKSDAVYIIEKFINYYNNSSAEKETFKGISSIIYNESNNSYHISISLKNKRSAEYSTMYFKFYFDEEHNAIKKIKINEVDLDLRKFNDEVNFSKFKIIDGNYYHQQSKIPPRANHYVHGKVDEEFEGVNIKTKDGNNYSLIDYLKKFDEDKPIVLTTYYSFCSSCIDILDESYEYHKYDATVIGFNTMPMDQDKYNKLSEENDKKYPVIYDLEGTYQENVLENDASTPQTYIIKGNDILYYNFESDYVVYFHESRIINAALSSADRYFIDTIEYTMDTTMYTFNFSNYYREGIWNVFYKNGQLEKTTIYKEGEAHGEQINYYEDGVVESRNNFNNGTYHGKYSKYYLTGELKEEYYFKNGIKSGTYKEFHKNGKLSVISTYVQDMIHGKYLGYFENEEKEIEGNVYYDKVDGNWNYYHNNGVLKMIIEFEEGLILNVLEINDRQNLPLKTGTLIDGNGYYLIYGDNKIPDTNYVEKGEIVY